MMNTKIPVWEIEKKQELEKLQTATKANIELRDNKVIHEILSQFLATGCPLEQVISFAVCNYFSKEEQTKLSYYSQSTVHELIRSRMEKEINETIDLLNFLAENLTFKAKMHESIICSSLTENFCELSIHKCLISCRVT